MPGTKQSGRRRKPREMKVIEGSFRKDRDGNTPQVIGSFPQAPDSLSEAEAKLWQTFPKPAWIGETDQVTVRAAVTVYARILRVQEQTPVNWMKEKPPVPTWMAALYCVSFIGPAYHALTGFLRDGDARWLWHLPTSVASLLGVFWGMWTYKTQKGNRKLVAQLQVKQTLRK